MVDLLLRCPAPGAMGDPAESESPRGVGVGVCALEARGSCGRRMPAGFHKWLVFDRTLGDPERNGRRSPAARPPAGTPRL